MDAREAFETLQNCIDEQLRGLQRRGALYLGEGDTNHALEVIRKIDAIKALGEKVFQLRAGWEQLMPLSEPLLPVIGERTPPGQQTSENRYWLPILQALVELGGSGPTAQVVDRVGEIMSPILSDVDNQPVEAGEIRWRNRTRWVRADLVEAGYISNQTAHGVWEIAEKGREYLSNRQGR